MNTTNSTAPFSGIPNPIQVVSALGTKRMGMTRKEMIEEGSITNNGLLSAHF